MAARAILAAAALSLAHRPAWAAPPPAPWSAGAPAQLSAPAQPVVPKQQPSKDAPSGVTADPSRSKVLPQHTPMLHPLVGIALPLRTYGTGTKVIVQDPWGQAMVLTFNTTISPKASGPVFLTVDSDESGLIETTTRFTGIAAPYKNQERILWTNVRGPNGKVLWSGNPIKKAMAALEAIPRR